MRGALLFLTLFCLTGAVSAGETELVTADGCRLRASWNAPRGKARGAVLAVHGYGSDFHEWAGFSVEASSRGLAFLALDLRGHGKSLECRGRPVSYRNLGREELAASVKDLEAGRRWLASKGYAPDRVWLLGASFGAALAVEEAGRAKPAGLVLLSPVELSGRAYAFLKNFKSPVHIFASRADAQGWRGGSAAAGAAGTRLLEKPSGHGAEMFGGTSGKEGITAVFDLILGPARVPDRP